MDPNILAEIHTKNDAELSEIDRLKEDLADARFEIEGCRDTMAKLAAELRRIRKRYRAAAGGDL